jgi:hypothetical protein
MRPEDGLASNREDKFDAKVDLPDTGSGANTAASPSRFGLRMSIIVTPFRSVLTSDLVAAVLFSPVFISDSPSYVLAVCDIGGDELNSRLTSGSWESWNRRPLVELRPRLMRVLSSKISSKIILT